MCIRDSFLLGAVFTPTTMFEPSVASDSHDTFTPTKSNDLSVVTSHDVTPEQDKENRNINQKHELMVSPDGVVAALEFNWACNLVVDKIYFFSHRTPRIESLCKRPITCHVALLSTSLLNCK